METWLDKALAMFPEFESRIEQNVAAGSDLGGFWSDLTMALEDAYRKTPPNENVVGRIYEFAAWCFRQPESDGQDVPSTTAVGFLEDLPLCGKAVLEDLYRWMSVETFEGCKSLFRCHMSEADYETLHREFIFQKTNYPGRDVL